MMASLDPIGYGEQDDSDYSDDSASGVERVLLRRADGPRMMASLDPFAYGEPYDSDYFDDYTSGAGRVLLRHVDGPRSMASLDHSDFVEPDDLPPGSLHAIPRAALRVAFQDLEEKSDRGYAMGG